MRNPLRFFIELHQRQLWIACWTYYLVTLNFSSAFFWHEPLAKVIFFTFALSASMILGLYSFFGFEKIMGLGHIVWVPLLFFLFPQIYTSHDTYRVYLVVLTVSIVISLVFDAVDIWKFIKLKKITAD